MVDSGYFGVTGFSGYLMLRIGGNLDGESLGRVAQVSRKWQRFVEEHREELFGRVALLLRHDVKVSQPLPWLYSEFKMLARMEMGELRLSFSRGGYRFGPRLDLLPRQAPAHPHQYPPSRNSDLYWGYVDSIGEVDVFSGGRLVARGTADWPRAPDGVSPRIGGGTANFVHNDCLYRFEEHGLMRWRYDAGSSPNIVPDGDLLPLPLEQLAWCQLVGDSVLIFGIGFGPMEEKLAIAVNLDTFEQIGGRFWQGEWVSVPPGEGLDINYRAEQPLLFSGNRLRIFGQRPDGTPEAHPLWVWEGKGEEVSPAALNRRYAVVASGTLWVDSTEATSDLPAWYFHHMEDREFLSVLDLEEKRCLWSRPSNDRESVFLFDETLVLADNDSLRLLRASNGLLLTKFEHLSARVPLPVSWLEKRNVRQSLIAARIADGGASYANFPNSYCSPQVRFYHLQLVKREDGEPVLMAIALHRNAGCMSLVTDTGHVAVWGDISRQAAPPPRPTPWLRRAVFALSFCAAVYLLRKMRARWSP